MITKTYLDGKLNQLEERLKRRIDMKDSRQTQEINAEIINLKNAVKLAEEKVAENKDMIENYLKEHNDVKIKLSELERKIEKKESDIITSDF